jgi:SAM-dependent methyltransferase
MTQENMVVHDPETAHATTYAKYPVYFEVPPLPDQSLLDTVGAGTLENFYFVGEAWAQVLHHRLPAGGTVLDIGCGCGRTARFLLLRDDIRYVGFDIFKPAIDWCTRHLAPFAKGRFRFEHLDAYSAHYNPRGRIQSTQVRFPAADASIDVAFAASLFTHLLEPDAAHYLRESARCLKPGGVLVASLHAEPPKGVKFSGREDRIDIAMDYFIGMGRAAGLEMKEDLVSLCGQETVVFARR